MDPRLARLLAAPPVTRWLKLAPPPDMLLVGGAIRDSLLERPVRDFDFVVESGAEQLALRWQKRFGGRLISLGRDELSSIRIAGKGPVIDLWERGAMSVEDDLLRRDLTLNAIALEIGSGRVIDPARGLNDLADRRLAAPSADVFAQDPLRILRLARFAAELEGFTVERATIEAASAALRRTDEPALVPSGEVHPSTLDSIATERLQQEWTRLISQAGFAAGLAVLWQTGAGRVLLGDAGETSWDLVDHRLSAAARAARTLCDEGLDPLPEAALHSPGLVLSLLASLSAETRAERSPAFEAAAAALDALDRRGLSHKRHLRTARRWLELAAHLGAAERRLSTTTGAGPPLPQLPSQELGWSVEQQAVQLRNELRWVLHLAGADWPALFALVASGDAPREPPQARAREWLQEIASYGPALFEPPKLVDGALVAAWAGVPPGPALGELMMTLRRRQVIEAWSEAWQVEAFVRSWKPPSATH